MRKERIQEARLGNYNAKMRARVLNFLNELGREDITVQRLSNSAVNWFADCGKAELNFEFTMDPEAYEITAKDSQGDKIEAWAGEYAELDMDLDDTVLFVDEFKAALEGNPVDAPVREEPEEEEEDVEIEDEDLEDETEEE